MPRSLHKSWQNRRPGWTRRVRWYEGEPGIYLSPIRLKMEDEHGSGNMHFESAEAAQVAYNAFRLGEISTLNILGRKEG